MIARLTAQGRTLAVAESLTGGALTAELTRPAGASAVVLGGAVVYATELKHTIVGVDAALLSAHGPVHPEVARQLARGVRTALAVAGRAADIGIATTGVAGPDGQGGHEPGTVFVGISWGETEQSIELTLCGDRAEIRAQTVAIAVRSLADRFLDESSAFIAD
ncbi:nicotinamide-nucleotide amidohydrolase family protein [Planctomonas sp. JC2975]|uniref:CinA family protein n=1 Tax=Planctomonas sp. JC2975 TaxID=2729626 RepID=UPI001472AC9C|nr:CinA family protein [Planctomonas sp. JC2975]NNC13357.1 nicotinamide-nucleotide amidohydrolase family protein [Planctomonas sp. JC2975]